MIEKQTPYPPRSKLRAKRKSLRLSTAALGDLSGMDGTLINKIELGNRPIKIDQLERLAKALACPVADLLEDGEAGGAAEHFATPPDPLPQYTADDLLENAIDLIEQSVRRFDHPLPSGMMAHLVRGICNLAITGSIDKTEEQTGAHRNLAEKMQRAVNMRK